MDIVRVTTVNCMAIRDRSPSREAAGRLARRGDGIYNHPMANTTTCWPTIVLRRHETSFVCMHPHTAACWATRIYWLQVRRQLGRLAHHEEGQGGGQNSGTEFARAPPDMKARSRVQMCIAILLLLFPWYSALTMRRKLAESLHSGCGESLHEPPGGASHRSAGTDRLWPSLMRP